MTTAWRDPLLFHPRVAGRRWRGAAVLALGAALFVVAVLSAMRAGATAFGVSAGLWATLFLVLLVCAAAAVALGYDELRRPLHVDLTGRPQDAAIQRAALRWHPKIADVVDEYRRTTRLCHAGDATIAGAVHEELEGDLRARLFFDAAPFRVGATARMRFRATPSRQSARDCRPMFHLRCLRESPQGVTALLSSVECLADLIPARSTRDFHDGASVVSMEFDLPAGLPGADLLARQPVYWELTVEIAGLREPYRERFFVPVAA